MSDMAMKYAACKRAKKMAVGGLVGGQPQAKSSKAADNTAYKDPGAPQLYEFGEGDRIGRIMEKRYSKGGMVANETPPVVDSEPNEFDDLVLRDDLESSYTGANSGDEVGNAALDEDDNDMIVRIMRSRSKKDSMPRPA